MAVSYKVLGQSKPSAATLTSLYTVPTGAGNYAVVSTLNVCNVTADVDEIRVAIRVAGSAISDEEYIIYGQSVAPYQTQSYTIGITLAATDVVSVYSVNGKCSFNLFGSENS